VNFHSYHDTIDQCPTRHAHVAIEALPLSAFPEACCLDCGARFTVQVDFEGTSEGWACEEPNGHTYRRRQR